MRASFKPKRGLLLTSILFRRRRRDYGRAAAVRDRLDRIAANRNQRVVVVIDGLDEALQGSFDPAVLPARLPTNLRVLLSARWQVGDSDSRGWLKRLGWDRGVKVNSFELDRLDARGITDALVKLGAPVDVLAREPDLVAKLVALGWPDPALTGFLVVPTIESPVAVMFTTLPAATWAMKTL